MDNINNENIQNSEVNSASMHDVPLSSSTTINNDDQEDQVQGPIEKMPSKSGSLKRFFKLSSNKNKNANELEPKNSELDPGTEADNEEDENDKQKSMNITNDQQTIETNNEQMETSKVQSLGRSRSRRFNFRFGNNTAEGDAPTSSNNVPTASKHSLRSSLSTYFNSVFKRKQTPNSKHTLRTMKNNKKDDEIDNEMEKSIEMVEQKFADNTDEMKNVNNVNNQAQAQALDQIHNLNNSEENKDNNVGVAPLIHNKTQD